MPIDENDAIYEPREDSFLLQKYVEEFCRPGSTVLDMGTGTGIQGFTAAKAAKEVIACDINPESVKYVKEEIRFSKLKNIRVIGSDLFSKVPNKRFDLIIFNPPYLPEEKEIENKALFSAKRGTETTTKFIEQAQSFLAEDGTILITGSSLAKQQLIDDSIKKSLLESEMLEKAHVFFEDIYVMKIVKSVLLKKLEKKDIMEPKIFAHGKRGVIIKARYKKMDVAIKIKRDTSTAMGTIGNEARFLELLNKKEIGPHFIMKSDDFLMYKFVEGIFIFDFVKANGKKEILKVFNSLLRQLYTMDKMGVNKFEMHHPVKHIFVQADLKPVLIDFERARHTEDPKNVSQFCDFLISQDLTKILKEKGININKDSLIKAAIEYKRKLNLVNFKKILNLLD